MASYNKMYNKNEDKGVRFQKEDSSLDAPEVKQVDITETESPKVDDAPAEKVIGVVVNCVRLNLRNDTSMDAEVLEEMLALDEVEINLDESTSDFYRVKTKTGKDGYCVKKFIVIKE